MKKIDAKMLTRGALIAAVYTVITYVWPLSFGAGGIDVRVSECLCVLPIFMPEAVNGLFIGCLISNLLGSTLLDAVAGSLTTLLSAYLTRRLRNKPFAVSALPPVLLNAIITGTVVYYLYTDSLGAGMWLGTMVSVGLGEAVSVYLLGGALMPLFKRIKK